MMTIKTISKEKRNQNLRTKAPVEEVLTKFGNKEIVLNTNSDIPNIRNLKVKNSRKSMDNISRAQQNNSYVKRRNEFVSLYEFFTSSTFELNHVVLLCLVHFPSQIYL